MHQRRQALANRVSQKDEMKLVLPRLNGTDDAGAEVSEKSSSPLSVNWPGAEALPPGKTANPR